MKSYLSGNPEIRIALNEDLNIGRGGRSVYGIASFTPCNPNITTERRKPWYILSCFTL